MSSVGQILFQDRLRLNDTEGIMAKILIVDDQACIRELLSEELLSEGYRVTTAGDAESVSGHLRFSRIEDQI